MGNMKITWKTAPIVLLILAGIGAKVYFSMPGWKNIVTTTVEIPPTQSYVYQIETKKPLKCRINASIPEADLMVYLASKSVHSLIQSGSQVNLSQVTMINDSGGTIKDRITTLPVGLHFIYFEPPGGETPTPLSLTIEGYRE